MKVITRIAVDMTRSSLTSRVEAIQGDGGTRRVEALLLSNGKAWEPPAGVEAAIAYKQPSGAKGLYNKLADGSAAIAIDGNVATIILTPQMLAESGNVYASVVFYDAALNQLTTFPFLVAVAENQFAGAQEAEDYIRLQWLEEKLDECLGKYHAALTASDLGMDTKRILVSLPADGWIHHSAPYTQIIRVAGLENEKLARVYPAYGEDPDANLALAKACAMVSFASRDGDTITITCLEDKPGVDIPVMVEVYV